MSDKESKTLLPAFVGEFRRLERQTTSERGKNIPVFKISFFSVVDFITSVNFLLYSVVKLWYKLYGLEIFFAFYNIACYYAKKSFIQDIPKNPFVDKLHFDPRS